MKVGRPAMVRTKGSLRPMNRGPVDDEEMVRLELSDDERSASVRSSIATAGPTLPIPANATV